MMGREEEFENTFAPACENRTLAAGEIVAGMRFGAFKYDLLPPKVRKAVDGEVKRQCRENGHASHAEESKWRVELLKAMQDLEQRESGEADSGMVGAGPDTGAKSKSEKLGVSGIRRQ